jgi:mycothiol system anti-sigma-R factor
MSHDHASDTADEVSAAECADYLEQIVYFIDNELDEADCSAVREHLDSCNPCLAKYDLQRTVKQVVARSCSETAPGELRAKIMLRLQQARVEITEA